MNDASRIPSAAVPAVVSVAVAAGAAMGSLGPRFSTVVIFLFIWAVAAVAVAIIRILQRLRIRQPAKYPVSVGVRLRTPSWMLLTPSLHVLGAGALVAALVGVAGGRLAGAIILGLAAALSLIVRASIERAGITSIELRKDGMYAYAGEARVNIRWSDIAGVQRTGVGDKRNVIVIELNDTDLVLRSLEPDTEQARSRLDTIAMTKVGLVLRPWTGGVDSATIEKAILSGINGMSVNAN